MNRLINSNSELNSMASIVDKPNKQTLYEILSTIYALPKISTHALAGISQ